MKKLALICILFALFIPAMCLSADMHKVQLEGVVPFSVETSFPGTPENGSFGFRLIGEGGYNDLTYKAVVGISRSDKRYQILLVLVTTDGGKSVHVVAVMTANMVDPQDTTMISYRDEVFYSGKGYSGLLTKCKEPPSPKELEKLSGKKGLGI